MSNTFDESIKYRKGVVQVLRPLNWCLKQVKLEASLKEKFDCVNAPLVTYKIKANKYCIYTVYILSNLHIKALTETCDICYIQVPFKAGSTVITSNEVINVSTVYNLKAESMKYCIPFFITQVPSLGA